MSSKTEAQILADAYESVRNLSMMYISPFENLDINKEYELNDTKVNNVHWIMAHLVWTEHFLIIEGIGNEKMEIPWLEEYGFGTNPEEAKTKMTYSELMKFMEDVHTKAMEIINSISDEEIEKPNFIEAKFGGVNNKRNVIKHAIRHEPMHIGQLSWILKVNDVKMA